MTNINPPRRNLNTATTITQDMVRKKLLADVNKSSGPDDLIDPPQVVKRSGRANMQTIDHTLSEIALDLNLLSFWRFPGSVLHNWWTGFRFYGAKPLEQTPYTAP
jgi:hypothetical protein